MRKVFAIIEATEDDCNVEIEKEFEISADLFESIVYTNLNDKDKKDFNLSHLNGEADGKFKENRKHAQKTIDKIRRRAIPPKKRWSIMQRDNFRCVTCGRGVQDVDCLQVDHIHPASDAENYINGPERINEEVNLQTMCWECNVGKFNR